MLQQSHRSDPYPYTWEIPAAITAAVVLVLILGLQLGRSMANLCTGHGWVWPTGRRVFTSLPGILHGDAGAGLASGDWASPAQLTLWLVIVELLILTGLITAGLWGMRRWGPHRMKGMASADQAETVLGLTRLRKVRGIIRPDLYPTRRALSAPRGGHDGYHPTA